MVELERALQENSICREPIFSGLHDAREVRCSSYVSLQCSQFRQLCSQCLVSWYMRIRCSCAGCLLDRRRWEPEMSCSRLLPRCQPCPSWAWQLSRGRRGGERLAATQQRDARSAPAGA